MTQWFVVDDYFLHEVFFGGKIAVFLPSGDILWFCVWGGVIWAVTEKFRKMSRYF